MKPKPCFMEKLVKMLEESDPAVVRWSDSGTSFMVVDVKRCGFLSTLFRAVQCTHALQPASSTSSVPPKYRIVL